MILAVSLAILANAALAEPGQGGPGKGAQMMERLKAADTNGDGMISRDEARALPKILESFDRIDANKDGQITFDELRAFHQHGRGEHMKKADTDGDGRISRAEAAKMPRLAEHFDQIDANKDGYLSQEELQAFAPRTARASSFSPWATGFAALAARCCSRRASPAPAIRRARRNRPGSTMPRRGRTRSR